MSQRKSNASGEFSAGLHARLEEVVGYRAGDLPPEKMARVEEHLAGCSACRERLMAAEAVLAQVDLIAERPLGAESLEVELLLERLKLLHESQWRARWGIKQEQLSLRPRLRFQLGIRSPQKAIVARVAAMAKGKRKPAAVGAADTETEAAYGLWRKGDLKSARAVARELLAKGPSEDERLKLERLIRDTSPDPRALHVGLFCLAVVVFVVLLTKLFG